MTWTASPERFCPGPGLPTAMRSRPLLVTLALVAGSLLAAGTLVAQGGDTIQVTAVAQSSDQCGDSTWCWDVTGASDIQPGDTVEVTVEVPDEAGQTTHNLYVADSGYNEGGNTDPDTAIAGTDGDVEPGQTASFTFTAPSDASELYFWCDEGAHEQLGMWWTEDLAAGGADDGSTDGAGDGTDDADDQQSSPAIGLLAALVGLALVAAASGNRS